MPRNLIRIVGQAGSGKTAAMRHLAQSLSVPVWAYRHTHDTANLAQSVQAGEWLTYLIDDTSKNTRLMVEALAARHPRTYFILSSEDIT